MQVGSNTDASRQRSDSSKRIWIPPASGFAASVLMTLIGRATAFEYRREASIALFYVVMVLVGGYYDGRLTTRPAAVIGVAVVLGAVGAVIMHL